MRAAARALEASLVLLDRSGSVLAVAARSPADERSLLDGAAGVETIELRVADTPVGQLRMRARSQPGPALVRLVTTLVASEVERVRAPARASQEASTAFLRAILSRELTDGAEILARASELGIDLVSGGSILVARAHAHVPVEEGWRPRVLATAERGARAVVPTAIAAPAERETDRGRGHRARAQRRRRASPSAPPRASCASCRPACRAIRSRSGAAASRSIRWTCTARATRRCWPSTSPRATRSARCWPSSRPAPTACCCRR